MIKVGEIIKITFLLPGPPSVPVGGFRVAYTYANHLADRGHEVRVVHAGRLGQFTPPDPGNLAMLRRLWRVWKRWQPVLIPPRIAWQDIHPHVKMLYLSGEPQARYIPDGDIVVATAWTTAEYIAQYPRQKGRSFYLIQHLETWDGYEERVKETWHLPFEKIVVSQWLMQISQAMGIHNAHHIPNGIDQNRFVLKIPFAERELGICALYHPAAWKGSDEAVQVMKRIHAVHPTVPCTFFGTMPRPDHLPSWVRYYENPPQEVLVNEIYNRHTIFLSTSWKEGFALPPAEAMACGCVFVGTDSGGCRDYAMDGETALLSDPGDIDTLFHNLDKVIVNASLRRHLQETGYGMIKRFTWKRSTDTLEQLMMRATNGGI